MAAKIILPVIMLFILMDNAIICKSQVNINNRVVKDMSHMKYSLTPSFNQNSFIAINKMRKELYSQFNHALIYAIIFLICTLCSALVIDNKYNFGKEKNKLLFISIADFILIVISFMVCRILILQFNIGMLLLFFILSGILYFTCILYITIITLKITKLHK